MLCPSRHRRGFRRSGALALGLLTSCVSYRPAPVDPAGILDDLNRVVLDARPEPSAGGFAPRELAALAVTHQPALRAARAELGVADARLVEAGLLPDPALGWDAMDVLAAEIDAGSSGSQEVLSGFGIMFPLPRPGERDARVGAAEARRRQALRAVLAAEWELTREVHLACEEVVAAERLRVQSAELADVARSTDDYFERAREAGVVTAIQANLAEGQLHALVLETVVAGARLARARQALNGLLGLPPSFEVSVVIDEDPAGRAELRESAEALTAGAVARRPDLAELLAGYEVAEQDLRLAVAGQYPLLAIGTGISITPGLLSEFGRPAIHTATARRDQLRGALATLVHEVRREIHAGAARLEVARRELAMIETRLLPNAEATLELSRVAFDAGEVTLLESLALQRALVEARTRHTEARAEVSSSAWDLLSASGLLLEPDTAVPAVREEAIR